MSDKGRKRSEWFLNELLLFNIKINISKLAFITDNAIKYCAINNLVVDEKAFDL